MNAYVAHLRGGPRHGQTTELEQPALCLLLPEHDGEAVYDLCASRDYGELIYRYSHTDREGFLEDTGHAGRSPEDSATPDPQTDNC